MLDQLRLLLLPLDQPGFNFQGSHPLGKPCVDPFNGLRIPQLRIKALQSGGCGPGQITFAGLQMQRQ
ncbi:hypothetical protein D9M72_628370 [compost metagenome]